MSLAKEAASNIEDVRYDLSKKNLIRYLNLASKKWDNYETRRVPNVFAPNPHRVAQELADTVAASGARRKK